MWTVIIALLLIGLTLIIIELIFIPGTTVVGLLGLIFAIVGVVVTYVHHGSEIGIIVLAITLSVSLVVLFLSFRSGAWSKFSLKSVIDSKVNEGFLSSINIGDVGVTVSALRPIGKAEFNQKTFEVKTSGSYVDSGQAVKVTQIESYQIVVEPLKN
ncbi:MAG: NfeD family protein [Chryseolinea sp.]